MAFWSQRRRLRLPQMERDAEQAMKQVDPAMKRVDEAKDFLSRAQACATEQNFKSIKPESS
jgi:hypothetical protein